MKFKYKNHTIKRSCTVDTAIMRQIITYRKVGDSADLGMLEHNPDNSISAYDTRHGLIHLGKAKRLAKAEDLLMKHLEKTDFTLFD